jgi:DNA-binding IclR family transcriptional regulator
MRSALGTDIEEALSDPVLERITDKICAKLAAFALQERWVSQSAYIRHYGISKPTVCRRGDFLRSKGAIEGSGKMARYDITVTPMGKRLLKT